MNLQFEKIDRHRNGMDGAPFNVLIFDHPEAGRMLGIVFDNRAHVAVLNLDKLAAGDIEFDSNSWRGDRYEPYLRKAIERWNEEQAAKYQKTSEPSPAETD